MRTRGGRRQRGTRCRENKIASLAVKAAKRQDQRLRLSERQKDKITSLGRRTPIGQDHWLMFENADDESTTGGDVPLGLSGLGQVEGDVVRRTVNH